MAGDPQLAFWGIFHSENILGCPALVRVIFWGG